MKDDLKNEVEETVEPYQNEGKKWLAVNTLLNKYKKQTNFMDIRRRIVNIMRNLTGKKS
jgi:hypothetical protein